MGQIAPSGDDVPDVVPKRRCRPDRRSGWRGGRRDTDWWNRPADALARIAESHRRSWRQWLQAIAERAVKRRN